MEESEALPVTKSGQPQYFSCSHDGCDHTAPQSCGPRIMVKHECRFQLHAEHYKVSHNTCKKCIELTEAGEWTADGGRDDFMCRHSGCGYYSSSPRPANRKQAVERHEVAFPIHYNHFINDHTTCGLCRELLESNIWSERDGEQWLSRGNNQVIARLTTKEQQNGNLPPPKGIFSKRKGLKAAINRVRAPGKKSQTGLPTKKSNKRKRDDPDSVEVSREAAETLFGLYLVASSRVAEGGQRNDGSEPHLKRQKQAEFEEDPVSLAGPQLMDTVQDDILQRQEAETERKTRLAMLKAQIMETISGSVSPRGFAVPQSPRADWATTTTTTTTTHAGFPAISAGVRPSTPEAALAVAMLREGASPAGGHSVRAAALPVDAASFQVRVDIRPSDSQRTAIETLVHGNGDNQAVPMEGVSGVTPLLRRAQELHEQLTGTADRDELRRLRGELEKQREGVASQLAAMDTSVAQPSQAATSAG